MVWDKRPAEESEELSELDRKLIGPPRILTIPLEDPALLRSIGDLLTGLGRDMQFNARRDGLSRREIAQIIGFRINEVNQRIRNLAIENGISMPRRGRKKASLLEQEANERKTNSVISLDR